MTALPAAATFQDEPMSAQALSDALVAMRNFLAGLLGTDGTQAGALAALHTPLARYEARSGTGSVAAADRGKWLACTGSWTLSLLAAATAGAGFVVVVANASTGTITVDPADAETIDGAATATLEAGRAAILISTGSGWATAALPGTAAGAIMAPAAGTAAAPALTFPGDTNTGIYRAAADTIGLATGGAARALLSSTALQVDVPVTGTAVQSSAIDTTVGRLMAVGAFGIGSTTGGAITDFTAAAPRNGCWRYLGGGAGATGSPDTSGWHGSVLVARNGGANTDALLVAARTQQDAAPIVWFGRVRADGSNLYWTRAVTHANLVGTVSQSGGVPTGGAQQGNAATGSPAGGYSSRLANGFQAIHHVVTTSSGADTTVTFTDAFLSGSSPAVLIMPAVTGRDVDLVSISPTAVVFSVRNAGARVAETAYLTVTGRWSSMT